MCRKNCGLARFLVRSFYLLGMAYSGCIMDCVTDERKRLYAYARLFVGRSNHKDVR